MLAWRSNCQSSEQINGRDQSIMQPCFIAYYYKTVYEDNYKNPHKEMCGL